MNIQKVNPEKPEFKAICQSCGFFRLMVYADLDGHQFESFYCQSCGDFELEVKEAMGR